MVGFSAALAAEHDSLTKASGRPPNSEPDVFYWVLIRTAYTALLLLLLVLSL